MSLFNLFALFLKGLDSGLGGLVVSALDFQGGYRGFESRSGRDNFQTIITPSSYSTCPGLSIKLTGRRLVTDRGTKCAWVFHESKAVQIHVHHSNRRCLYVPRVPGSVKNPHNNNNNKAWTGALRESFHWVCLKLSRETRVWYFNGLRKDILSMSMPSNLGGARCMILGLNICFVPHNTLAYSKGSDGTAGLRCLHMR